MWNCEGHREREEKLYVIQIYSRIWNIFVLCSTGHLETPQPITTNKLILLRWKLLTITYSAGSRRSTDPYTSRDTWPSTRCTWHPAGQCPTTTPRTRSSKWDVLLSMEQNCAALCYWSDRSVLVAFFYTRAFSTETNHIVMFDVNIAHAQHFWIHHSSAYVRAQKFFCCCRMISTFLFFLKFYLPALRRWA